MTEKRIRPPVTTGEAAIRELMVVREVTHAFLTAEGLHDVLQFALERVTPIVGASFSSVFLRDGTDDLMRLAAFHNWPERFRPFLGELRVRMGRGPSGEAAAKRRPIHVPDVFASEEMSAWQEIAQELGFRSLIALPLQTPRRVLGALTFYFADAGGFHEEEETLLNTVADQLAAAAEKEALHDELRRAHVELMETNAELERQYGAAVEARRLKDEFLSNISHELRTPLTSVLGYAYLLQEGMSGPLTDEQRLTLAQVTSSSERLLALIEDLLELAALKRGDYRVIIEEFDPRAVVHDAVAAAHSPPPGVVLTLDLPERDGPLMRSDRGKLMKVLVNLLANAYKFTSAGEVQVKLRLSDGTARFTIRDTGIGIPSEAQQMVFDEFRQVDGSPTRRYSGSGLGLSLCRQLVRLLGGDIGLVSVPDRGSEFSLRVPLHYTPRVTGDTLPLPAENPQPPEAT